MPTRLTIVEASMRERLADHGLTTYDDFLRCPLGQLIHESGTTRTRRIALNERDDVLYLKVYRYPGATILTREKARREAMNYETLRNDCGVHVPDVIAVGGRRQFGIWRDGFILTRAVPRAAPLDRLAAALWPAPRAASDDPLRRHLLADTAAMVARMHAAGFCHIDLQWRNLLISDDGSDAPDVYVIDSSRGGRRRGSIRREQGRLRDLSSLYKEAQSRMAPREQLRWLRMYLGLRRFELPHRALIRTIQYDRAIKDHEA